MFRIALVIKTSFSEIVSRIRDVVSKKVTEEVRQENAGISPSATSEDIRRSPIMASMFPCFYNKHHPHPVGKKHTCNSFLLGPSDYKKREGIKMGANTIIVSHWSGIAKSKKVAA